MGLNLFFALFQLAIISVGHNDSMRPKSQNKVTFSFTAKRLSNDKNQIEINGSLFNNDVDTLFFLSSSCDGTQYSLQFDSKYFLMNPRLDCFSSWPVVQKIPPYTSFTFSTYFKLLKADENKIRLGFDLYVISKTFDLKSIKLGQVHNRADSLKNIIWAQERQIE